MLVRMRVENFKSFNSMVELPMISSNKIQDNKDHRIIIKSTPILKHAVIYGANAAGKSNLVVFFNFFKQAVRKGIPLEAIDWYCKNREENKEKESNFEIQFTLDEKFYAYGFSAVLSERRFTGEWLYALNQDGTAKCFFECESGKHPTIGNAVRLSEEEKNRFDVYADDFVGNTSTLFLNEMNHGKKYPDDSKLLFFRNVYHWILTHLYVIRPNTRLLDFEYYYDDVTLNLLNKIIKTFDTGISEITIKDISMEELEKLVPKAVLKDVQGHIQTKLEENEDTEIHVTMRSQESIFDISVQGHNEPTVKTLCFHHGNSFYDFRLEDESDGTRRLFDLIDMLFNRKEDVVYIVDELERSLHPKLTERYLQLFTELHKGQRNQLIFTTHETSIMDQSLFRRDEIWFVERNKDNESVIYSLDRFKERYDKKKRKAYLDGRYGAIPVFSEFSSFDVDEET